MSQFEYMPTGASKSERVTALRIGAAVLRERWPKVQADCRVDVGPNTLDACVRMEWPGVIRVTTRYSGKLIAQSLPGKPLDLDLKVYA